MQKIDVVKNIFQSVRLGNIQELNLLLADINVNIINNDKQNLLHEAIASHQYVIAKMLINRGINLQQQDKNGQTGLHYAAVHKEIEIAALMLQNGADVNLVDKYGNNALWTATFNARGDYSIVALYLRYGGDRFHNSNNGKSAVDFAIQIKDTTLIQMFGKEDIEDEAEKSNF